MKNAWIAACLIFALGCGVNALSAEGGKKPENGPKKDGPKKDDPKDSDDKKKDGPADGSVVTLTGMMAVRAKDARSDVVCRLSMGNQKMDRVWNLVATGDLATKIAAMRSSGDRVKVIGKVAGDDIIVDKVERVVYMQK